MKKIIVSILVIIELCSLFLLYKSGTNKKNADVILDDVMLKEEETTQFKFFLEQTRGSRDYIEVAANSFNVELYSYNLDRSQCESKDGNILFDALSYEEEVNLVVLQNQDAYLCNIYYDKK